MLTTVPDREAGSRHAASPPRLAAGGGPSGSDDRSGGRRPFWNGEDAATFSLAVLTFASLVGLSRVFSGGRWTGPALAVALGVHTAAWAARRRGWNTLGGTALAAAAAVLLASWTVLGSTTAYGVPTGKTFTTGVSVLNAARRAVSSVVVPVQPTTGFVLAAVLATAVAAAAADWLAFRRRSAVLGALPSFAMFIAFCALGYGPGRQWVVTAEAAALLVFALVHRASFGIGRAWLGGISSRAVARALPAGAVVAAASILVVVLLAPAAHGPDGSGVLGWRAGGIGAGGPREVANPIVDLHTRLVNFTDVGVFTVKSTAPSYWRLTSLDTFTGQAWISTNSYKGFARSLPGVSATPPGTRTITDTFHVQTLESVWLPASFTPVSVRGVRGVDYDPTSSSLITSHRTSDGLDYSVTAYEYLSTLDPSLLRAAPPVKLDSFSERYLALPSSVPQSVYDLAQRIVAGKHTEYDKAVALQDFFLGPSFTYSLDPPNDGYNIDALTTFLFNTRTGYCQQFAGAYAVLARAAGLPTRLAVGFTPGTDTGGGTFQVLDADAHTWPEVYFGPKFGWLPFEPTKSFSDPNAASYAGSSGGSGTNHAGGGDVLQIAPKTSATTTPRQTPATTPQTSPARRGNAGGASQSSGTGGWTVALVLLLLVCGWVAGNAGVRRARWWWRRWKRRDDPAALVLSHWQDTGEVLSWWGIQRLPGDTDAEYAHRAAGTLREALGDPSPWVASGVRRLASLASEALFAPSLAAAAPEEAAMVAAEIRQRLFRKATARRLMLWAVTQRPGGA